jgi:acylphosphatase
MATLRFVVSGRVQGVFFRASTRAEATRLGLAGSAQNLDDGRVEVIATGPDAALDALERWLWQGPPSARVEAVSRETTADWHADGFQIR